MTRPRTHAAARLLAIVLLLAAALAWAGSARAETAPARPLSARLASALAVPNVDHRRSAALAVELAHGGVVFARNPTLPLVPASTEKLALSYALLASLGPVHRIETRVLGAGALEAGTWRGDLVLKGHGDPTLSTAGLRRLAVQLRGLGVRRVTGSIVGDETFFDARRTAPGWRPHFYINESAPLSALVVNDARYRGVVVHNPALTAAATFRAVLVSSGVSVRGGVAVGRADAAAVPLAAVASPPLVRVLRRVNRESDNFTAELLLKHLGAVRYGRGTTAAGAAAVREILHARGIPVAGVRIVDGSGLSRLDRVTAETLVAILVTAWRDPLLRGSFLASLAVAGRNGTLERRLTDGPATGKVLAKTGTTSRASALAGYVGGSYAFAVLQNGAPLSPWWCQRAQDRFVTVLAKH